MQLCEEVADGLAAKGHDISVLTSTHSDGVGGVWQYPVHRLLQIDPDWNTAKSAAWQFFLNRRQRESQAISCLLELVSGYRPDVIFIWHAIGLPRLLLQTAERISGAKVVYYLAGYLPELPDEYIAYWQSEPVSPLARIFKRPVGRLALGILAREGKPIYLKYQRVICVSEYVRHRLVSQGLIPPPSVVIHNGVNLTRFKPNGPDPKFAEIPLRCLIAGRVSPEKGIHTVLEAMAQFQIPSASSARVTLAILGDGPKRYIRQLREKVHTIGLASIVEFRPPIPREQMPAMLSQHHVLILPSEYGEPIARAMQEAMAMGLLVIGTTTGGSGELLVHERTGLVFEPGNSESLVTQLTRAIQDPKMVTRLAKSGQEEVVNHFDIRQTIDRIEDYLVGLMNDQEAGAFGA